MRNSRLFTVWNSNSIKNNLLRILFWKKNRIRMKCCQLRCAVNFRPVWRSETLHRFVLLVEMMQTRQSFSQSMNESATMATGCEHFEWLNNLWMKRFEAIKFRNKSSHVVPSEVNQILNIRVNPKRKYDEWKSF